MGNNKVSLHEVLEVTSRIEDKLDRMEVRISTLEIWKAEVVGKTTVLIGMVNIVSIAIWEYFKSQWFKK